MQSTACKKEYTYAIDLGKPVLPVLVREISLNILPESLSGLHLVDYQSGDKGQLINLVKAINNSPQALALPSPLPLSPTLPVSYLGKVWEEVNTTDELAMSRQPVLLFELKKAVKDQSTASDALALLSTFRKRHDILAAIAEEIDDILSDGANQKSNKEDTQSSPPSDGRSEGVPKAGASDLSAKESLTGESFKIHPRYSEFAKKNSALAMTSVGHQEKLFVKWLSDRESESSDNDTSYQPPLLLSIVFGPFTWFLSFRKSKSKLFLALFSMFIAWHVLRPFGDGIDGHSDDIFEYSVAFIFFIFWLWPISESLKRTKLHPSDST